jgi:hypothetical protein
MFIKPVNMEMKIKVVHVAVLCRSLQLMVVIAIIKVGHLVDNSVVKDFLTTEIKLLRTPKCQTATNFSQMLAPVMVPLWADKPLITIQKLKSVSSTFGCTIIAMIKVGLIGVWGHHSMPPLVMGFKLLLVPQIVQMP